MSKKELRKSLLAYRRQLGHEERARRDLQLSALAISFLSKFLKSGLHTFLPIARNTEPNTFPIADYFLSKKIPVFVSKTDFENHNMTHYRYDNQLELQNNQFGIPEPTGGSVINSPQIDAILIPSLAIDRHGNRLGYGKGFYDQLLGEFPPSVLRIALSLSDPLDQLPVVEPHDQPVKVCITPFEVMEF